MSIHKRSYITKNKRNTSPIQVLGYVCTFISTYKMSRKLNSRCKELKVLLIQYFDRECDNKPLLHSNFL